MESQELAEYKNILVEALKFLDAFCKSHNIKYFAEGGTAIGAVRHKGFIPWDDDMDVAMFREDYDRFLSLKQELAGSHYRIIDYHDNGYFLPAAKFIDMNTTIWEVKEQPYIMGAYIDVFPYDDVDASADVLKRQVLKYQSIYDDLRLLKASLSVRDTMRYFLQGHLRTFLKRMWEHCRTDWYLKPNKDIVFQKAVEAESELRRKKGDFVLNYNTFYPLHKEILDKKWFDETIAVPFESTTIEIPAGYDSYLSQLFGDYMELPPEKERVSHHSRYFMDLHHHYSIEDVLEIIRRK